MRKCYFYTRDKSNAKMWIENTPQTGDKELMLHVYDGAINFCFEEWSEYRNKLPLVVELDNGSIAVVFVVAKYGDCYLKKELQSGKREAIKIVRAASPVYLIKKPTEVESTVKTVTWNATTKKQLIAVYDYAQLSPHDIANKILINGQKEDDFKFYLSQHYGGTIATVGKNFVGQAGMVSLDETFDKAQTITSFLEDPVGAGVKQPQKKIVGEFEII